MIKAVIFDMFETLVTLFEGRTYFGENIAEDVGVSPEVFRKDWHAIEHDRSIGKYSIEEGISVVLKKLGIYTEEKVQLVARKRREALSDTFAAIPEDSLRLLEKLHEKGLLVGLITNTFSDERDMIRESPLFPLFDAAMISYEQGICKPDPEIYRRMLQALNVKPQECLYVGDGGSKELFVARELGMQALQAAWFRDRAFEPHIPCYELKDFPQVKRQLDVLKFF